MLTCEGTSRIAQIGRRLAPARSGVQRDLLLGRRERPRRPACGAPGGTEAQLLRRPQALGVVAGGTSRRARRLGQRTEQVLAAKEAAPHNATFAPCCDPPPSTDSPSTTIVAASDHGGHQSATPAAASTSLPANRKTFGRTKSLQRAVFFDSEPRNCARSLRAFPTVRVRGAAGRSSSRPMRILVTGVSGVRRRAPRAAPGGATATSPRGFARDPRRVAIPGVRSSAATPSAAAGLDAALDGVEVAYYLIHSMEPAPDAASFAPRARRRRRFAAAARAPASADRLPRRAASRRRARASPHLASRLAVERSLLDGGCPARWRCAPRS